MNENDSGACDAPLVEINIQDVIRDRMAERKLRAEEKRQTDLQRIRDLKSATGIDPLQRFPKEIWAKIFAELDPEDRGNVCQIHPLFRNMMESSRIRDILFPQVLQVILSQYYHLIRPNVRRRYFNSYLRRISKSTRESYDRFMEDRLVGRVQENQANVRSYDRDLVNLRFNEDNQHELKRLLACFEDDTSRRRFFPRGLTVCLSEHDMELEEDNPMLMDQFKEDITALLKRIGDQILHFRFFLEDLETVTFSFSQMYTLLQGWVSLMPNLKWLEVLIQPSSQIINEEKGNTLLGKYPFPHLAYLERLSFHSTYKYSKKKGTFHNIYGVILGANQHIKMLDLNYDLEDDYKLAHLPAHLTQSLQLKRFTVCDEYFDSRYASISLAKIQPIINSSWKLETIVLTLTSDQKSDSVLSVLRLLQNFPTLEKVKFNHLEDFEVGDTDRLGYLELPNLKDFEIELTPSKIDYKTNIHFFFSLQFLVKCKELKRISWTLNGLDDMKLREHMKKFENRSCGNMLDFRAGLRCLYDSNIWQVFQGLEAVDIEIRKDKDQRRIDSCVHEYLRKEIEGMTIRKFWKSHVCNQYNLLKSCVL